MAPLVEVSDLRVRYAGEVDALRGVSLTVDRGERLAIVGESGAGKSTLAQCLVGLLQPPLVTGSVRLEGDELLGASDELLRSVRWEKAAIALQGAPLNPVATVGAQIAEPLRRRAGLKRAAAGRRAARLAEEMLLDPSALERHPHELSGGERRRAMIAMALALDPELLILDEPAAGLDPVTKEALLSRVGSLARERGLALVVISHDLPAAVGLTERALVLYAGEAMEEGACEAVIGDPAHPYTWALVRAYPMMSTTKDLHPIRGQSPDPRAVPPGCPFHPRCTQAKPVCAEQKVALAQSRGRRVACHFGGVVDLLSAAGLALSYRSGRRRVPALSGVSLVVRHGEAVGVVGASGSGKTTLARIIAGDLDPDEGTVILGAERVTGSWRRGERMHRRAIQLVRQDPWDALSPRLTVEELIREPLHVSGAEPGDARRAVEELLAVVGLPSGEAFLRVRTHELSGGQLQRIALARALAARPSLVVADEPTSMLDASEQARLLVVLRQLQVEYGLALVLVSHDIAVVRKVTDRTLVLENGRLAEEGPTERVCTRPDSEAARRLIVAAAGGPGEPARQPTDEHTGRDAWTAA